MRWCWLPEYVKTRLSVRFRVLLCAGCGLGNGDRSLMMLCVRSFFSVFEAHISLIFCWSVLNVRTEQGSVIFAGSFLCPVCLALFSVVVSLTCTAEF